ncbi:hypothetical protein [Mycoplasma seminis]|uniref:DUF4231 domain-containing protein n=1 Tax=Mycoplasma seminis TaxID=512749 RepID=A0ABY9HBH1_9MOLU|nr:hypothetical protein [Mycoplasma seminis]WLP85944.1 hypothetical protein Q8852_02255 [Mycoplasma seminis]
MEQNKKEELIKYFTTFKLFIWLRLLFLIPIAIGITTIILIFGNFISSSALKWTLCGICLVAVAIITTVILCVYNPWVKRFSEKFQNEIELLKDFYDTCDSKEKRIFENMLQQVFDKEFKEKVLFASNNFEENNSDNNLN